MIAKSWKTKINITILSALVVICAAYNVPHTGAVVLSQNQKTTVGATYYGGHYDSSLRSWVIDNKNQCDRIKTGEFSAASLGAVVTESCSDDNGLGYQNDIPLHNQVSFAELSNNPSAPDYSALGNLAAGTKLLIEYNGRCVVAEKRDVGQGGSSVYGHQRAIDFWWQTARTLNFTNGFDAVDVTLISQDTPLTPLNQTISCSNTDTPAPASAATPSPPAAPKTTSVPTPDEAASVSSPTKDAQKKETTKKETGLLAVEKTPIQGVEVATPILSAEPAIQQSTHTQRSTSHTRSAATIHPYYIYLLALSVGPMAFGLFLIIPRLKRALIAH